VPVSVAVAVPLIWPQVVAVDDVVNLVLDDAATDTVAVAEQPLLVTVTV